MPTEVLDLRTLLRWIKAESKRKRADKRQISHALAKGFMDLLEREGVKLVETGTGNANYFCAEIAEAPIAISPFGSHEEFWEKLSEGFRSLVARRACRWGVVLFVLPEEKGLWFEGNDYDTQVLQGREKVNSFEVRRAERSGIAHTFRDSREFLHLITHGPKIRSKTVLVKKRTHD